MEVASASWKGTKWKGVNTNNEQSISERRREIKWRSERTTRGEQTAHKLDETPQEGEGVDETGKEQNN